MPDGRPLRLARGEGLVTRGSRRSAIVDASVAAAALLAYNNVLSLVIGPGDGPGALRVWTNAALLVLMLTAARARGYGLDELGLRPSRLLRGFTLGFAAGLALAVVPVAFIALAPLVTGEPVENEGITSLSGPELALRLGVRVPIGTALFEEAVFRGVLYAMALRAGGERAALVGTALVFALWHTAITSMTVAESGVVDARALVALGVALSLAGLFAGGVIFAWLRWRTGSIGAAVGLHWSVVSAMTIAVWARA
ncbi:MAG TPA: CPBP family intramembrane glutamic endopeptidase [Candidatus Tectomicrobia bacterium]|nr:CPBP family intramembrane glutamic endopeptidase [Candidatus Tectomicrobia bacterium]